MPAILDLRIVQKSVIGDRQTVITSKKGLSVIFSQIDFIFYANSAIFQLSDGIEKSLKLLPQSRKKLV